MSYEAEGFDPTTARNVLRVEVSGGNTAYIVDAGVILGKLASEGSFTMFNNQHGYQPGDIHSTGTITHATRGEAEVHTYSAEFTLEDDERVATEIDFIESLSGVNVENAGLYPQRGAFSNQRFLINDQLALAYTISTYSDGIKLHNDRRLTPTGTSAPYGMFVEAPERNGTEPLQLLVADVRAHMIGHVASIRSRAIELPDGSLSPVITPDGEMFKNPDTQEWVHKLSREAIGTIAAANAPQVPEEDPEEDDAEEAVTIDTIASLTERKPSLAIPPTEVRFDDIGGLDTTIEGLRRILYAMKNPEIIERWGAHVSRGILLYGPERVGKDMLVHAFANELGADVQLHTSADVYDKWIGNSESAIKKILEDAATAEPAVLFFDEIDGLFHKSASGNEGRTTRGVEGEFKSGLPKLLASNPQVAVFGATNRPDRVPDAIKASDRLGTQFYIPLPNEAAREDIVRKYLSRLRMLEHTGDTEETTFTPVLPDIDTALLARVCDGFNGADIKEVFNRTALGKAITDANQGGAEPISTADLQQYAEEVRIERSTTDTA